MISAILSKVHSGAQFIVQLHIGIRQEALHIAPDRIKARRSTLGAIRAGCRPVESKQTQSF
jgi:hypothetical protein